MNGLKCIALTEVGIFTSQKLTARSFQYKLTSTKTSAKILKNNEL